MFRVAASLGVLFLSPVLPGQLGNKFEPPAGRVLHGVGQIAQSTAPWVKVKEYEQAMGASLAPAIDKAYLSLSRYFETRRPIRANFLAYLGWVGRTGKTPEVGIDILPDRDFAAGKYDGQVRQFAKDLKAFGKPFFARFGVEIASAWNPYTPGLFPVAWRRITDILRAEGADNVATVWCIAAASFSTFADFDRQGKGIWYPGDDYVDWMGLDLFNAFDFTPGNHRNYRNSVALCEFAARRKKPVMIAECTAKGMNLSARGDAKAYWSGWFAPFFKFLETHPVIRSFHYINWDWSKTRKWPTWGNADITVNPALVALYRKELGRPRYLHKPAAPRFEGPWPRQGRLAAVARPFRVDFDGAQAAVDAFLVVGAARLVTNPSAPEKLKDYGVFAGPLGFLKTRPDIFLYAGKTSAAGSLQASFPAAPGRLTAFFQLVAGLRLSTEMRLDL